MVLIHGYVDLYEFKEELGDERSFASDAPYERAISAASRWIDRHCQRRFWLSDGVESKLVRPTSRVSIRADYGDFPSPATMTVEVDAAGNGVFAPISSSLWQAEPFTPDNGWPYEHITPTGEACWPVDPRRPRVKLTGIFGWSEIPPEVAEACALLARAYLNASDVTGTRTGFERYEDDPMSPVAAVKHLLHDFAPHGCGNDRHGRAA